MISTYHIDGNKNMNTKSFNLITCGGQSSIPIIYEISKELKKLNMLKLYQQFIYAGLATRANIDEYLKITSQAVLNYTKLKNVKSILNINPGYPPVNMSNSIYIELKNKITSLEISKVSKIINFINKRMKSFAKGYKAEFLGKINDKCLKIT